MLSLQNISTNHFYVECIVAYVPVLSAIALNTRVYELSMEWEDYLFIAAKGPTHTDST